MIGSILKWIFVSGFFGGLAIITTVVMVAPDVPPCKRISLGEIAVMEAVKRRLVSPATADFAFGSPKHLGQYGECGHIFIGELDSQNAFGAIVRTKFRAIVELSPTKGGPAAVTELEFL